MHVHGVCLDNYSLCSSLKASSSIKDVSFGKQVHVHVIKSGYLSSVFVGSALIDLYAKSSSVGDAKVVFDEIPVKNSVCANALLLGYCEAKLWDEVLELVRLMPALKLEYDNFTLSAMLRACAGLSGIEFGRQAHAYLIRKFNDIVNDVFVQSSLIEMYGKCGLVWKALQVFDLAGHEQGRERSKDVVLWTSMLGVYGRNGHFNEVIQLFEAMLIAETELDGVAFVTVISACGHTGQVKLGVEYFESMIRDYKRRRRVSQSMINSSSSKKQVSDQPSETSGSASQSQQRPKMSKTEDSEKKNVNKKLKDVEISVPIVYGNVAFWLGKKASEYQSHKWTVYVRGATNEDLGSVIKRVVFQLHSSFNNPTRVLDSPPFEISESGWGEFEIAITLFFHNDLCDKPLNLFHHLKLYPEDESGPMSTKKPVVVESYDEIVFPFPEPSESFLARVQNYPAVTLPRLPAGFTLPAPVPTEDTSRKKRGDTKDHPLNQLFMNFSEADELLQLAAARQQVQAHIAKLKRQISLIDGQQQQLRTTSDQKILSDNLFNAIYIAPIHARGFELHHYGNPGRYIHIQVSFKDEGHSKVLTAVLLMVISHLCSSFWMGSSCHVHSRSFNYNYIVTLIIILIWYRHKRINQWMSLVPCPLRSLESYDDTVFPFPEPSESFLARVQNYPAITLPRLPAGFTLPAPVPTEDSSRKKRGDTKDQPLNQFFMNFSGADELLQLAAALQQQVVIGHYLKMLTIFSSFHEFHGLKLSHGLAPVSYLVVPNVSGASSYSQTHMTDKLDRWPATTTVNYLRPVTVHYSYKKKIRFPLQIGYAEKPHDGIGIKILSDNLFNAIYVAPMHARGFELHHYGNPGREDLGLIFIFLGVWINLQRNSYAVCLVLTWQGTRDVKYG
ncbi:hypothetical protein QYF36_016712 [Acer negundo]|nr:hypothetical protein QYF36_016712 [Acer negundo]